MSISSSGTITATTGLSSGIDYNSILTKMRQADSIPITLLQQKEQTINTGGQALNAIQQALQNFSSALSTLTQKSSFLSLSSFTSDSTVLTAAASSTASAGSYSVYVRQTAQAARFASQGVATIDKTSIADADGTFSFRIGSGSTVSVNVKAGESLQEFVDSINNVTGSGVSASIINDGVSTNPYRLVLTASASGAANTLTVLNNSTTLNLASTTISAASAATANAFDGTATSSGTYTGTKTANYIAKITTGGAIGTAKYKVSTDGGLTWSADDAFTTSATATDISGGLGVSLAFGAGTVDLAAGDSFKVDAYAPTLQQATDAVLEVNGIQVRRSTNTISDVIQGVTLTAKKVSTDPQSVTVNSNSTGSSSQISAFVQAYNSLFDTISQLTSYDTTKNQGGPLFGDTGVNAILDNARRTVSSFVPGLSDLNSLSSIGVSFDNTGHLLVDSTKLNSALADHPDEVASLFTQDGHSSSSAVQFLGSSNATPIGNYLVNVTQAAAQGTVTGTKTVGAGGLTASEQLTIVYGDSQTAIVNLAAGSNIDQIVAGINGVLQSKGLPATASSDGGKLKIATTGYGSAEKISVISNRDGAAAGQLGIGTTTVKSAGKDAVAIINGTVVNGTGQDLLGPTGSKIEGLHLKITATAPATSSLTLTQGIASQLQNQVNALTDSTTGLFVTRSTSIANQIKDIDAQILTLNNRLDQQQSALQLQFQNLETRLSTLQSQGNFLLSQLSSLVNNSSSSSSSSK